MIITATQGQSCGGSSHIHGYVPPPFNMVSHILGTSIILLPKLTDSHQSMYIAFSFTGVVTTHYDNYEFYKGVDCIMAQLRQTNGFMESVRPWELRNDIEVLNVVLHIIMENLRVCSILLQVMAVNIRFIVISL